MIHRLDSERILFRSDVFAYVLQSQFFCDLFSELRPLLDGKTAAGDLINGKRDGITPTTVEFLLKLLTANAIILESSLVETSSAFSDGTREALADPNHIARWIGAVKDLSIHVIGIAALADRVADACEQIGLKTTRTVSSDSAGLETALLRAGETEPSSHLLIALATASPSALNALNDAMLAQRRRWTLVTANNSIAGIGPTFIPFETCCLRCADTRLRSNQGLSGWTGRDPPLPLVAQTQAAPLAPLAQWAAASIALELINLYSGNAPPATIGQRLELTTRSPIPTLHTILRMPHCESCGKDGSSYEPWSSMLLPGMS